MESWNPRVVLICTYVKSIHFKMKTMTNVDISSEPLTYSDFGKRWRKNPAKAQKTTWKSTRKGPEQPMTFKLWPPKKANNSSHFTPFYSIHIYSRWCFIKKKSLPAVKLKTRAIKRDVHYVLADKRYHFRACSLTAVAVNGIGTRKSVDWVVLVKAGSNGLESRGQLKTVSSLRTTDLNL